MTHVKARFGGNLQRHSMTEKVVMLDVRADLRQGREPFPRIMKTLGQLAEDQSLRVVAPFHPEPLCAVLAARGFQNETRELETGDWEVLFSR